MGAPQPVYYGGLVMGQVRHFDTERERPGLPPDIAALVERIDGEGIELTLVNCGGAEREVIVQAGAYGEHEFEAVRTNAAGEASEPASNAIRVVLPSASRVSIDADLERYVDDPSYAFPWV